MNKIFKQMAPMSSAGVFFSLCCFVCVLLDDMILFTAQPARFAVNNNEHFTNGKGTRWARSDTKRRIWYAMACTQHRRLLSSEGASSSSCSSSRGPRPPCDLCRLVRFAILCHVMGAMENNAHTAVTADLVDFAGGPPSDARAAPRHGARRKWREGESGRADPEMISGNPV